MHPMKDAGGIRMVYMIISFCEKEKQFRGYRDFD
jgi:hypothetical protein